jgi:predicted DNA-binding protein with PD1-like motif
MTSILPSGMVVAFPLRLKPGDDLVSSMEEHAISAMKNSGTTSSFVLTAVGSLENVALRMANACNQDGDFVNEIKEWNERLEIVSMTGTFSLNGKHLHMSVSDGQGHVYGGHLVSGKIFTTLELVIGVILDVDFSRVQDPDTGFKELDINPIK